MDCAITIVPILAVSEVCSQLYGIIYSALTVPVLCFSGHVCFQLHGIVVGHVCGS